MPPEDHHTPSLIPIVRHPSSPEGQHLRQDDIRSNKNNTQGRTSKKMKFNVRGLIPMLMLILASFSLLRLVRILITTSTLNQSPPVENLNTTKSSPSNSTSTITAKEFHFLSKIIKQRSPCNLLIFGLVSQYLNFQLLNAGGKTMILEDKIRKMQLNSIKVYKVEDDAPANQAYALLKHARRNPDCGPKLLEFSTCQLALKSLSSEANHSKWDIVVVDGPAGDSPDAPGRMAAIYTASLLARAGGNSTDVVVHDVDRTVEKWFSWELLCEENLVFSKGKFWHFKVTGQSDSTRFCNPRTVQIQ